VKKRTESTARNIIYPILARHWGVGLVTVVDEDINIYDSEQVEWAVSSRVRPDRDVIIIQPVQPAPESVSNIPIYEYKWGIDATAPMTKEPYLYKRAVPPGVDKVDYV
jgi:2,5-furandicarboxylate decarboxylase 1